MVIASDMLCLTSILFWLAAKWILMHMSSLLTIINREAIEGEWNQNKCLFYWKGKVIGCIVWLEITYLKTNPTLMIIRGFDRFFFLLALSLSFAVQNQFGFLPANFLERWTITSGEDTKGLDMLLDVLCMFFLLLRPLPLPVFDNGLRIFNERRNSTTESIEKEITRHPSITWCLWWVCQDASYLDSCIRQHLTQIIDGDELFYQTIWAFDQIWISLRTCHVHSIEFVWIFFTPSPSIGRRSTDFFR